MDQKWSKADDDNFGVVYLRKVLYIIQNEDLERS